MPTHEELGVADIDPALPPELRQAVRAVAACTLAIEMPLERHCVRCMFAELAPQPSRARRTGLGMGTPVASAASLVADAGLTWIQMEPTAVGLAQWGEHVFCLVGAGAATSADLSAVVDHAVQRCLGRPPTPSHVAVCNPSKVVGFWHELAYLPPQFGWPAEAMASMFERLTGDDRLPPEAEPPVVAVVDGPSTAARLVARSLAQRLNGYVAINELHAPARGLPCVVVLDGEAAAVALHRLVARLEAVVVPPPTGIAAIVVRVPSASATDLTPHLAQALSAASALIVLPAAEPAGA